jgi:lipoic acid synthetase
MGLSFCVLTMVTRDDLPDGGASHIVQTISAVRNHCGGVWIEVLISDLCGNWDALGIILSTVPEVTNHNIETAGELYNIARRNISDYFAKNESESGY